MYMFEYMSIRDAERVTHGGLRQYAAIYDEVRAVRFKKVTMPSVRVHDEKSLSGKLL
jgi:hypothetical protein